MILMKKRAMKPVLYLDTPFKYAKQLPVELKSNLHQIGAFGILYPLNPSNFKFETLLVEKAQQQTKTPRNKERKKRKTNSQNFSMTTLQQQQELIDTSVDLLRVDPETSTPIVTQREDLVFFSKDGMIYGLADQYGKGGHLNNLNASGGTH